MSEAHSIAPFPADLDRDAFGHWLSGFTDGEGCFSLTLVNNRRGQPTSPSSRFSIGLRADDHGVLNLIQSYWQCGTCNEKKNRVAKGNENPQFNYSVTRLSDLVSVVVAHFEKYPLRSKKAADFKIWKEAVLHAERVHQTPAIWRGTTRGSGYPLKWVETEKTRYVELMLALKEQRKFRHQTG